MILFTHFGYSSYLEWTLRCAKRTNPGLRCVLIGDDSNREVARRCGWEHYLLDSFHSPQRARFNRVFRHVQGPRHVPIRNNKDWLKYVFERWFVVEAFIREQGVESFWHFDSDNMILEPLQPFQSQLAYVDSTTQCNDSCLNGYIRTIVVAEYVDKICALFEDEAYLRTQQEEFDTQHPDYAFTEMRAFIAYRETSTRCFLNLQKFSPELVFDDCVCQDHGYQMIQMPFGRPIKAITFVEDRCYIKNTQGQNVRFATLNLSWVPVQIFKWVYTNRFRELFCPGYNESE